MGLWAGTRIICLGEYNDANDLPSGVTEEEKDSIKAGFWEDPNVYLEDWGEEYANEEVPEALADAIERGVRLLKAVDFQPRPYMEFGGPIVYHSNHLPEQMGTEAIRFVLKGPFHDDDPSQWVLRDITAREFVRADGLIAAFHDSDDFEIQRNRNGPHFGFPDLGDAALRRICYSTDTSTAPCAGINRGVWAGHRLDICTMKRHHLLSDTEWKDVTEDVIEELRMIL